MYLIVFSNIKMLKKIIIIKVNTPNIIVLSNNNVLLFRESQELVNNISLLSIIVARGKRILSL